MNTVSGILSAAFAAPLWVADTTEMAIRFLVDAVILALDEVHDTCDRFASWLESA